MRATLDGLFDIDVWRPALANYGAVTGLSKVAAQFQERMGRLSLAHDAETHLFRIAQEVRGH